MNDAAAHPTSNLPLPFVEFVLLITACMALMGLGVDFTLAALGAIGNSLGVAEPNHRQFVITAYIAGFGGAHLIFGPLADRFGRRRVLLPMLALYTLATAGCALATSFPLLLAGRAIAGGSVAGVRVAIIAGVRDCVAGRQMARVMSIAFMVFMIVPILAPSIGDAIQHVANWRSIFAVNAVLAVIVLGWYAARMPETLAPGDVLPISVEQILSSWALVVRERVSLGYTLGIAALNAALYGYLNSIPQIMSEVFHRPRLLGAVFAACAGVMAAASLGNSRIVMRVGMRPIAHGALVGMVVAASLQLVAVALRLDSVVVFTLVQAAAMGCFGLATANFSSMAMEKMGHIAGTAQSVQSFASILSGALAGASIGLAFNATVVPMTLGFLIAGVLAIGAAAYAEQGRLFRTT